MYSINKVSSSNWRPSQTLITSISIVTLFVCLPVKLYGQTSMASADSIILKVTPQPSNGSWEGSRKPFDATLFSDSKKRSSPPSFELFNLNAPGVGTTIEGINFDEDAANSGFYHIPPDPIGTAGPNHLISVVNTSIEWFTKAGVKQNSQRLGKNSTSITGSFFESLTPANATFDPKVIYDQYAGRFLVVTLERVDPPATTFSRILIAVSDDSDPNGTWYFYAINSKILMGGVDHWADYPGFAVDEEAVYITANMYTFGSKIFGGSRLWIVNKTPFYTGGSAVVTVHDPSVAASLPDTASTLQPAHMFGTGPTGVGTFLVTTGWVSGSTDFLSIIRIDNPLATPTFSNQFISLGNITTGSTFPDAPQQGTTVKIETNDVRALNAIWRNNALWTTNTVVPPSGSDAGQATAHWYKINTSNLSSLSLQDQGNVGGEDIASGTYTFFPSIAVDASGNMAIGFAASGPNIYPGAYYTGRLANDPAGTVQPTGVLRSGLDFYIRTFSDTRNRWGDYSGISVDPVDDATFWVFNEYAITRGTILPQYPGQDGRWGTAFGGFTFAPTPSLSINDASVTEGNTGTTNASFTVTLSAASGQVVTVNYATANGTATAGSDYVAGSGTVTFPAGSTTQTITVVVNGDVVNEPNETFLVDLSGVVNATIADAQGQGTIVNDDDVSTLSINDVSVTEGNIPQGGMIANFTVMLSAASGQQVTVNYATADGSASSGSDYVAGSSTVTFTAGTTTQTITVAVNGDAVNEPNETFLVNLSGAVNATIADAQGQGTIVNDDGVPTLSINDVTVTEGSTGTVNASFTVTLSAASGQQVTVDYATANGTATVGSDYVAGSGTVAFTAGTTTQTIPVAVNGDLLDEPNETFFVNLSNPTNATIAGNQGQGTINDDDPAPLISINDVTVTEGNTGAINANFTVTLSAASGQQVTVNYVTADGTATAGSDYMAGSGTVTFAAGTTTQTVTIVVNGDVIDEPNETLFVNLSNPTNATIADNQGQGTITDDDPAPSISINDLSVTEDNTGTTNANFTVTLSAASGQQVTGDYVTVNGTTTAGSDYVAGSGIVTFTAGITTQTITVLVNGDVISEPNETFFVNLINPTNATIADAQGQGTITDDDGLPSIAINDVTVTEGNTGTVNANFTVTLSAASGQQVTVDYATANGTAPAGSDYVAGSGTVTFSAGTTTPQTITVVVNGDLLDEPNETFFVNLSNAANATIADNQGQGTITDDDGMPSIAINDVTVTEGNTGTVNANFTVTLSAGSGQQVTVDYATTNGTATAGSDYVAGSGTAILLPAQQLRPSRLSLMAI